MTNRHELSLGEIAHSREGDGAWGCMLKVYWKTVRETQVFNTYQTEEEELGR